jgi:hypothetical protein
MDPSPQVMHFSLLLMGFRSLLMQASQQWSNLVEACAMKRLLLQPKPLELQCFSPIPDISLTLN